MQRLKKDGTPAKKPGRKPDPNRVEKIRTNRHAPRPHVWLCGPDEYKHSMYIPWLRAKAQANFRSEGWELSFEEYYEIWKNDWDNRGRKSTNVCMTRYDARKPWSKENSYLIQRIDHLKEQNSIKIARGYKSMGRPSKNKTNYTKMRVN